MAGGLRFASREEVKDSNGRVSTWRLKGLDGAYIPAFDEFMDTIRGKKKATRRAYAFALSKFIDYLFAAGVLGRDPINNPHAPLPSAQYLNQVIDYYPTILQYGCDRLTKDLEAVIQNRPEDAWKLHVVKAIRQGRLKPNSFSPALAAVNTFLRQQERNIYMAAEIAELHGVQVPGYDGHAPTDFYQPLIRAVSSSTMIPFRAKQQIVEKSILGAASRLFPDGLPRPSGLQLHYEDADPDLDRLDFPILYLPALLEQATSWRDKAFWLVILAYGLRYSEALGLTWDCIDFANRRIWVYDPDRLRFGNDMQPFEVERFKGRIVSRTFPIPFLKDRVFEALRRYFIEEHAAPTIGPNHNYVFRYLRLPRRGMPYHLANDVTIEEPFKNAVAKAKIPGPPANPKHVWTLQSLRHAYGVFMRNLLPVPGGFGLSTPDIKILMGKKDDASTEHYAREEKWRLQARLQYADMIALSAGPQDIDCIPTLIANRLMAEARKLMGQTA